MNAETHEKVMDRMWELSKGRTVGKEAKAVTATAMEAFLEYYSPPWTSHSDWEAFLSDTTADWVPPRLLAMVRQILEEKPGTDDFPQGKGLILVRDDAAGDPASLATHCIGLMKGLKFYAPIAEDGAEQDDSPAEFKDLVASLRIAVDQQLDFLLNEAPRTDEGAISHRLGHVSLWADFVYMVPPFLASYAWISDEPLYHIRLAYDQCRLYRDELKKPNSGLWRHIIYGGEEIGGDRKVDPWAWSTSNGWVAAGLWRTAKIIEERRDAKAEVWTKGIKFEDGECSDMIFNLRAWALEILEEVALHQTSNGMIRTYVDEPHMPEESCGTALLAHAAYRIAEDMGASTPESVIKFAHRARAAVLSRVNPATGLLQQVGDIRDERLMRAESAEGQAFVILMEAAARDWEMGQGDTAVDMH